jgi:streptogramin lyase
MDRRKFLLRFIVLGSLLVSLALAFNMLGYGIQHSFAQSLSVGVTDFYLKSGQEPWGTTFDSSGHVWIAIPGCDPSPTCSSTTPPGRIEEYDPSASKWLATYALPAGYAQPLFLAFDAQGNLWFPMPMANSIGMLNLTTKTYQQFPVPTAGAGPWDIAIDHHGNIWFTEHYSNKIGELNPTTQTVTEISTPASNSQPYGIVVDASNNIWFTENNSAVALIGEYTSGGTLNEYKIRTTTSTSLTPHLISVDRKGNIWWTEGWAGKIGKLTVAKAIPGTNNGVTEYSYPKICTTCTSTHTSGISVDTYGQIWFDDSEQGIFGSFPETGKGIFNVYLAPTTPNAHPHDGLNVDAQNRIWFTEVFANKIAEAVQTGVTSTETTLAQDNFQRPDHAFWGKASDSLTWGADANSSSAFSIANFSGQVSNGSGVYNAVLGSTATNAEVLFSGSMSNYTNTYLGAVIHWSDSENFYRAYISKTALVIQKRYHNSTTTLGSVPFIATAGTSYMLRFQAVGTTLNAKVWPTGTTEPTSWMTTVTDSSLASGFCGLQVQLATGVTASYTAFLATAPE